MRAERRNITVSSERVSVALDRAENVSKFIERAVLFYLDEHEKVYAEATDLAAVEEKLEILNQNYLQMRDIVADMAKVLFNEGANS